MTVSGIRGSGQISFNLSVPEILPLSVWYSGKTIAAPVAKSASIGPANPASILFKELDRTRKITIDRIPIDAVGSPMTYSEASSRDLLVTIDGTHYDANALLEVYAKVVQLGIRDAITRRLNHIHMSPVFILTDNGGHVLIYPDLRKSQVILGTLPPGRFIRTKKMQTSNRF